MRLDDSSARLDWLVKASAQALQRHRGVKKRGGCGYFTGFALMATYDVEQGGRCICQHQGICGSACDGGWHG